MRNLFVCHTQAHLILACGLSKGRFRNDENHLVLFKDFNLNDEMRSKLEALYDSSLFLTGIYPASNKMLKARLRWYQEDNKLIKDYITKPYDRVFAVCDWYPPVQYCLKQCYGLSNNTQFMWLEDGIIAYFQNAKIRKGTDRYAFTLYLRKVLFKYIWGMGCVYDRDFQDMGGLSLFKQVYTLYPDAVREPYRSTRELIGITEEEYLSGVNTLYDTRELDIPNGSILLVMDKLDTYLYPEKVQNSIAKLKNQVKKEGRRIFCKFHPREEKVWPVFDGCIILEKTIGAESLYLSLASHKESIEIIGIKSAGLMSARKMGFNVSSLFNKCGEENEDLCVFFKQIKINLK